MTTASASQATGLTFADLDDLPYGAIQVDAAGTIHRYNRAEARLSGRDRGDVIGRNFFDDIAPCTDLPAFRGRFEAGIAQGNLDLAFEFVFDFAMTPARVRIDMKQAAEPGLYWLLVNRIETLPPFRDAAADRLVADRAGAVSARVLDKAKCDREAIHIPGAIQPHGAVLVADPRTGLIQACSGNVASMLERAPSEILGANLADVAGADLAARLVALAEPGRDAVEPPRAFSGVVRSPSSGMAVEVTGHAHDGRLILECEPHTSRIADQVQAAHDSLYHLMGATESVADSGRMVGLFLDEIRRLTGFERILLYRFDPEGHGMVIGESLSAAWGQSFLGLNFPASDIPQQARALYQRHRIRAIPNNGYRPVPLLAAADGAPDRPVDLTFTTLRSMSPIHRAYLDNMGVLGTFSVSVMQRGQLWGLLIGHHRTPRYVAAPLLRVLSATADRIADRIDLAEAQASAEQRDRQVQVYRRLLATLVGAESFVASLTTGTHTMVDLFEAIGGAACRIGSEIHTVGRTPPDIDIQDLLARIRADTNQDIWSSDCLSGRYPHWYRHRDIASGALVVFFGIGREDALVWFRPESVRTVTWAGSPRDLDRDEQGSLLPRRSFERWTEEIAAHSQPWETWALAIGEDLRHAITDVLAGQMQRLQAVNAELREARDAQERFIANMNHELRTPLNAILGFSEMMELGIGGALSPAHAGYVADILSAGRHLLDLVNDILDFTRMRSGKVTLRGEPVDMATVAEGVVAMLEPRFTRRGLIMRSDVPADLIIVADTRAIRQILLNLLSNAVKFTDRGGRVDLMIGADGRDVVMTVTDTGRGIPADRLATVTDPFAQYTDILSQPTEGTGLGLSIVDTLVRGHGGHLAIASEVGVGTTVRVRLPRDGSRIVGVIAPDHLAE